MRRVSLRRSFLVLVALAALLGPPAAASASDAGLKALVTAQRAAEKRFEAQLDTAAGRLGSPSSVKVYRSRVVRFYGETAKVFARVSASYDRYRKKFAGEAFQTPEAQRGRSLMVSGLRDGSKALTQQRKVVLQAVRKTRKARTAKAIVRIAGTLDGGGATKKLSDRGDDRLKRGRSLITKAPAPDAPVAPTPTPAPAPTPTPTPAPAPAPDAGGLGALLSGLLGLLGLGG
ncbi:hypothetical protein AB0L40_03485 [Patulibacter sp. NPDC049589]|uniref:hypothetical protein n=1 Tax=Patulibacter sp. NPDC049589 TaxID=3154731 RepID=UPI00342BD730